MTTAPTAAPKTADGKPRPAKLDHDRIAAEAAQTVATTLGSIEDTQRRLKHATSLIDEANGYLENAEPRMKKMALHLALNEHGVAVYNATSMSRYAFYKMVLKVKKNKTPVRVYSNAEKDLPPLATEVIAAQARLAEATKFRDDAIVELVDGGMKHSEVAELIGRERSRVTQIVSEAKKRTESE